MLTENRAKRRDFTAERSFIRLDSELYTFRPVRQMARRYGKHNLKILKVVRAVIFVLDRLISLRLGARGFSLQSSVGLGQGNFHFGDLKVLEGIIKTYPFRFQQRARRIYRLKSDEQN